MSELSKLKQDPDVFRIDELRKDRYVVRYNDGSALMVNAHGETIRSPLQNYDVVQQVRDIGELQGMPFFAFKACNWATRNQTEIGLFDYAGHERAFLDPRMAGLESLEAVQHEFNKLVIASHDQNNPRRNDPMMADLSQGKSLTPSM